MSNLVGTGVLAEYQDLFTSSSTSGGVQLGGKAVTGDGREFRFVLAGATALVPGKLQQSAAETTTWENLAVAAAAIGSTKVVTTSTVTATANQWAGAYLAVTVTAGQGYMYQIKGNTAATSAVTTITLADPLIIALDTSSRLDVILSPYNGVIVNPSTATGAPVGSAIYPVTAAQYGWIQTAGPANILAAGAIAVGVSVVASASVVGAVTTQVAGSSSLAAANVGTAMEGISDTEYGFINLNLS